jgi:hypothetical protein
MNFLFTNNNSYSKILKVILILRYKSSISVLCRKWCKLGSGIKKIIDGITTIEEVVSVSMQ